MQGFAEAVRQSSLGSAYAYRVASQSLMFPAAVFIFIDVFGAARIKSCFLAAGLTRGFFSQHVFDLDAWSQLAAAPIYVLALGLTGLSFATETRAAAMETAVLVGILIAAAIYLYPESMGVYGLTIVMVITAAIPRRSSNPHVAVSLGISGIAAAALMAPSASDIARFAWAQISGASMSPDWWRYFQPHLFGRADNFRAAIFEGTGAIRLRL
jgi:hypothetical protein